MFEILTFNLIFVDVVSSNKVVAMEAKVEALSVELEQNNIKQETVKQKMEH
jgi:hypothetical protein